MKEWQFCYIIGMVFLAANSSVIYTSVMSVFWLAIAMVMWIIDKE